MSYNDPFESEGTAGTVNFDAPAGGGRFDSSGFSSDSDSDSGSPTFTRGKSGSRGGTQISGNTIYGGQIISDKTLGRNYDFESEDYQKYLDATGRSMQNPYGNTGLFSGIFGADKVNYNLDPTTAKNILDAGFDRYNDFLGQDSISQNRGFGKLFGGPEGEMTAQGEVRKQVTPMSTSEIAARLAGTASGLGAPLAMLPGRNVGYAPMGSSGYSPQLDPQVNSNLKSGPFSLLTGGVNIPETFGRVKDFITSKLSPAEELAEQTQTQARGPELSQTVSGGRFEDESARPQVMTPDQEFLTFDGRIQDSLRQQQGGLRDNPALVSDASDLLPNVFEIMQQNEFLNNLLEDGTLYETEGGKKFKFDMEDGNPQLKLSIPFSTA